MRLVADPFATSVAAFRLYGYAIEAQMRIGALIARSCVDVMFASPEMRVAPADMTAPARHVPRPGKPRAPARKRAPAKPATESAAPSAQPSGPRLVASSDAPASPPRAKPKRAPSPPPPMPERASTGTDEG